MLVRLSQDSVIMFNDCGVVLIRIAFPVLEKTLETQRYQPKGTTQENARHMRGSVDSCSSLGWPWHGP